jgi:hypothetical protein
MSEHNAEERYRQDTNRLARLDQLIISIAVALGAIALIIYVSRMPAPPQRDFYYPDPTPIVIETRRIEIFSNNFSNNCVGWTVQCDR